MSSEIYEFVRKTKCRFTMNARNEVRDFVLDRPDDCTVTDYLSLNRILIIEKTVAVEFSMLFGEYFNAHTHENDINIEVWKALLDNVKESQQ